MAVLPFSARSECITSDNVKFRIAPSRNAAITWKVRKFLPVKKLEENQSWVKVMDFEGDKHWVFKHHVTKKYHCVVVKVDEARIKLEPSEGSRDKFKESAMKYETFRFVSSRKGWIQVMDVHGDTGWLPYRDVWVD